MKRTALALISTFLLAAVGLLFFGLASANPVPWPSTPNQDKPTLIIESPINNTAYKKGDVYLNFTVTKPDSWDKNNPMRIPYMGQIASVKAYLDGNNIFLKENSFNFAPGYPVGSYSAILNDSASALHVVNVTVLWYAYYRGPAYNGSHILSSINSSSGPVYQYPMVVSDTVYFTVVGGPSPSPSPPPQETQTEPFPTTLVATVSGASIAVVIVLGLLVYFKKHKQ